MVEPIKPKDVKNKLIPEFVLEAFNHLINESWDGTKSVVLQDDVIKMLVEKDISSQTIFDRKWLDVEGIYSEAGWKVKYESPDRGEDFDSYFTFKK